jgi:biotin carboxyl carrier protein
MLKKIIINNNEVEVEVLRQSNSEVIFIYKGNEYAFERLNEGVAFMLKGPSRDHWRHHSVLASQGHVVCNDKDFFLSFPQKKRQKSASDEKGGLISPMPGKILKVNVSEGDRVESGDALVIMEAMKMEHTIKAPLSGVVEKVFFAEGEQVQGGVPLVALTGDCDEVE